MQIDSHYRVFMRTWPQSESVVDAWTLLQPPSGQSIRQSQPVFPTRIVFERTTTSFQGRVLHAWRSVLVRFSCQKVFRFRVLNSEDFVLPHTFTSLGFLYFVCCSTGGGRESEISLQA